LISNVNTKTAIAPIKIKNTTTSIINTFFIAFFLILLFKISDSHD